VIKMERITTFKFLIEENGEATGDIRRVTLKSPVTFSVLCAAAKDILGWDDVSFRFKDEDGDFVTVASQHELDTAIALANGAAVRFHVSKQAIAAVQKPECNVEVKSEPKPEPKAEFNVEPIAEPVAEQHEAEQPAAVPVGSALETAANATIPENIMVQFSAIAEFFQRMAQQMAEFAPRIPVIVNEGIRKMSADMQNNFAPLDVTVEAARNDAQAQAPLDSYGLVVHRLPESVVHPGIECAHCHKKPITGMRYKCVQCDCDLCQDCIVLPSVHTEGHTFLPVCAPAVGSHFINSASEACSDLKNRAAPVVQNVRAAVTDAVADARNKGAEIGDKVKQQVADARNKGAEISDKVKQQVANVMEKKAAPEAGSEITEQERAMLVQLADMGFTDQEKLLPLIRKHKDLNRVVELLLR